MATSFSGDHPLPAGVETAYAVLTSAAWPAAVAARLHDDSRVERLEQTADGGAVLVHSRRLPDGGPPAVRGLLPQGARVTQTDAWGPAEPGGARRGTWEGALPAAPGSVHGSTMLTPAAGGCTWTVAGEVSVSIPLVGGRAERFLADVLTTLTQRQAEVLRELLAAQG